MKKHIATSKEEGNPTTHICHQLYTKTSLELQKWNKNFSKRKFFHCLKLGVMKEISKWVIKVIWLEPLILQQSPSVALMVQGYHETMLQGEVGIFLHWLTWLEKNSWHCLHLKACCCCFLLCCFVFVFKSNGPNIRYGLCLATILHVKTKNKYVHKMHFTKTWAWLLIIKWLLKSTQLPHCWAYHKVTGLWKAGMDQDN